VGGRWCSCDEDAEGPKLDGRGCAVGPMMVDGGENAALLSRGGATGPNSQQCILTFAIWGDVGFFTIRHQATV
jgi:hypothetical protein